MRASLGKRSALVALALAAVLCIDLPSSSTAAFAVAAPSDANNAPARELAAAVSDAATSSLARSSTTSRCVTGEPTSGYISKAYVDWIWEHRMKKDFQNFSNFIFDQLLTNNGKLSYCIRWDSPHKLSKATASKFKAMLERQYAQWNKWLIGYGCWPFDTISIDVVGIAVNDKTLLDWTDDSLGRIYEGVLDGDGVPTCPDECYKHRDFAKSADTSACDGRPFDISLWPTLDQGGGVGGDWGQRVDEAKMLATIDGNTSVIVAHEIGHGFGLPDFYHESEKPGADMPDMIMEAGKSKSVTKGDGWLVRRGWDHVRRQRYPALDDDD